MYDTWKLRSDLDELARNHAIQPDDLEDYTKCATCGDWIHPEDDAHMVGFKSADGKHEWDCELCWGKRPEVVAGREQEAQIDRRDDK